MNEKYHEEAALTDFGAFEKIVRSRRSVRVFEEKEIPESVVKECLRLALLAPNSSNLQPWEFYWIRNPEKKRVLAEACFDQSAARTAAVMIVVVARTKTWDRNRRLLLQTLEQTGAPSLVKDYYKKLVPLAYGGLGPFGIFSPLKWLILQILGVFRTTPRDPVSPWGLKIWAHKTTPLRVRI